MRKDRPPVILTTTSEHLARAVDRLRERFPTDARPDKNALLNDLAAALRPGSNWGGLLAAGRTSDATAGIGRIGVKVNGHGAAAPSGRLIPEISPAPGSTPVAALVRRVDPTQGILEAPPFTDELDLAEIGPVDGRTVVGLVLDISENIGGFDTSPFPKLLLRAADGAVSIAWSDAGDLPSGLAWVILGTLQNSYLTDWPGLIVPEGIASATIVLGPAAGAAVLPSGLTEAVRRGDAVDRGDAEAVRLLLAEDAAWDAATALARLVEAALPALAAERNEAPPAPVHLRLDDPAEQRGLWRPLADAIPAPPWPHGWLVRERRKWTGEPKSLESVHADTLSYVLGEALAFAMDYHGVPAGLELCLDARCREITPRRDARLYADDWRILVWQEGRTHEWCLDSGPGHELFRRRLEAWLQAERGRITPARSMPSGSVRVLTERSGRRNLNHWERARRLFDEIT